MKCILFVFIILFTNGCVGKYQEPIVQEYATISIPHTNLGIGWFATSYYFMMSELDENGCVNSWEKIDEKNKKQDYEIVKIPAGKDFAIRSYMGIGSEQCIIDSYFKPEANKHYVISSKISSGKQCYVALDKKEGNQTIIVELKKLHYIAENIFSGKYCKK